MSVYLIHGSATHIPLRDESVQCVVASPPYWGLRKYAGEQELVWGPENCTDDADPIFDEKRGVWLNPKVAHEWRESRESREYRQNLSLPGGSDKITQIQNVNWTHGMCRRCGAWRGAFGLEPTVELYVQHTIQILREIRRVLRKDGVVFWNIGDSYHNGDKGGYDRPTTGKQSTQRGTVKGLTPNRVWQNQLKPKDLVLMPSRIALAAQVDGWWVRSVIAWAKPNPMPESVTDRPTDSWEPILMLTKSERYFWDAFAVREKAETGWNGSSFTDKRDTEIYKNLGSGVRNDAANSRNMRNLWMFATQPYSGAHFATFPEELPRRCILAATGERGACAQCGAPWRRITEEITTYESGSGKAGNRPIGKMAGETQVREDHDVRMGPVVDVRTIGWEPSCKCDGVSDGPHEPKQRTTVPCIVLDPFGGSGTTGRVAVELNRRAVLLDIAYDPAAQTEKESYAHLARQRTTKVQRELPLSDTRILDTVL